MKSGRFHFREVTAAAILFMAAVSATRVEASAIQNFTLSNQTPHTIASLQVSPTGTVVWGEDILGGNVLPSGSSAEVYFPPMEDECYYDLLATYLDGDQAEWDGVNLCAITRISLFHDEDTGETHARAE